MKKMDAVAKRTAMMICTLAVILAAGQLFAVKPAPAAPVDLNQASVEELMTIPGIGAGKAQAIVAYRQTAPFKSAEELINVKGIGEKMFAKISPYVVVSGKTAQPGTAANATR